MKALRIALWWLGLLALVAIVTEIAVWPPAPPPPLPPRCPGAAAPDAALFLIGDAGAPRTPEPLLAALAAEAGRAVAALGPERVAIVFLGDDVYPHGLRAPDDPGRPRDERRLGAQLAAIGASGAHGWLVPGNHDWSNGADDGLATVRRETAWVDARGATMVPPDGCPGPVVQPLGATLRLVFLDTQWWLQRGPRPIGASGGCAAPTEAAAEAAIAGALSDSGGRRTIVLAHHPLRTGGPHGGRFGPLEHLFPLRQIRRALWIPLPVLGSLEPIARELGVSDQDLASTRYGALRDALRRAFAAAPPLVYAAGHDHSLQLLRAGAARFQVVSGAGSADQLTWVHPIEGTLFAAAVPGYVRLDASADGSVELRVHTVVADAPTRGGPTDARPAGPVPAEPYRACLTAPAPSTAGVPGTPAPSAHSAFHGDR